MIYVFLGAVVALFTSLCIMAVGCLIHFLTKRKVLSPWVRTPESGHGDLITMR